MVDTVRRLLGFVSPWALAGIAVWMVILAIAHNWAIPLFTNASTGPQCADTPCPPPALLVDQPGALVFALVAASVVTALLAGVVVVARLARRR